MRNELCVLITLYQENGEIERKETEVFCNRKSSNRSEYYAAYAVGLKPRHVLEIDPLDWENASVMNPECILPNKVIYRGTEYNIYRDYQTNEATLELTIG